MYMCLLQKMLTPVLKIRIDAELDRDYKRAYKKLDEMENLILHGACKEIDKGRLLEDIKPVFSKEEYCEKVNAVKQHIIDGDIFQLVLSNPMEAGFEGSLFDTATVFSGP